MTNKRRQPPHSREQRAPHLRPRATPFKMGIDSAAPKRKFYAVRHGLDGFSGVLTSWDECRLYVHGVPNSKYKSFKTLNAAQSYLRHTATNSTPAMRTSRTASQPAPVDEVADDEVQVLEATDPSPDAAAELEVYTDGACLGNGKRGSKAGYGVYFGEDNPYNVSEPLTERPTNQRAEMTAVLEALQIVRQHGLVSKGGTVKIYSDSMYTINGMDTWLHRWRKSNWKTAAGTPVKNKELWLAIESNRNALRRIDITVNMTWVRGHVGIPGNEAADRLAVAACL